MAKVSVIIVTYNSAEYISKCLSCLKRQTFGDFEVVIVDNASSDKTIELSRVGFPEAKIIELGENIGFAEAHNIALDACDCEFIATLNPDAFPESDWLSELVAVIETDARCGSAASSMLIESDPARLESAGVGVVKNASAKLLKNRENYSDKSQTEEVFSPSGGAALFRRSMIDEVGFFEKAFFMYYEEVDLAFRARSKGWKCLLAPRARCHHASAQKRAQKIYYLQRNRLLTIVRCWPLWLIVKNLHAIILYNILSFWGAVLFERNSSAIKARFDFLKMFPAAIKHRFKKRQVMSVSELEKWLMGTGGVVKEVTGFLEKFRAE